MKLGPNPPLQQTAASSIASRYERLSRPPLLNSMFDLHRFPPPRLMLDEIEGSDNDYVLHGRLLGSHDQGRKVPWYPK